MKAFIGIFYLFYTESNVNKKSLLLEASGILRLAADYLKLNPSPALPLNNKGRET